MKLVQYIIENPEYAYLITEWDPDNGPMKNYMHASMKEVKWKCRNIKHHQWSARLNNRTKKFNPEKCPVCSCRKICQVDACNSLYYSNPELRNEWDKTKNGDMKAYFPNSKSNANWICPTVKHHRWEAVIQNRTRLHSGCPICTNRKICEYDACNSLYYSNPELRKEWNTEKNDSMKTYLPGSNKTVYWICKVNPHHEWPADIHVRSGSQRTSCPICINQKICPKDACNSLYYSNPELRKEWNEELNGSMKKYTPKTDKTVNWICSKDPKHTWDTIVNSRTHMKSGCPYCTFKSEQKCREILQELLGIQFKKCKPKFLNGYELDGYNEDYKIAFEYNGKQHYKYVSCFHRNESDLETQIGRDELKEILCEENDITLIVIPYTYSYLKPIELRQYIINEILNYCPDDIIQLYETNKNKGKRLNKKKVIEV